MFGSLDRPLEHNARLAAVGAEAGFTFAIEKIERTPNPLAAAVQPLAEVPAGRALCFAMPRLNRRLSAA